MAVEIKSETDKAVSQPPRPAESAASSPVRTSPGFRPNGVKVAAGRHGPQNNPVRRTPIDRLREQLSLSPQVPDGTVIAEAGAEIDRLRGLVRDY